MAHVLTISGSPQAPSRTGALVAHVARELAARGHTTDTLAVRDLDPAALLHARTEERTVADALLRVARADALVIATPVYKASYTGVLKAFLDLLPQLGLTGKVVLPLATGGTLAHVLAVDYALRPVLASLAALHVTSALFILDKTIAVTDAGLVIDAEVRDRLTQVVDEFALALARVAPPVRAAR